MKFWYHGVCNVLDRLLRIYGNGLARKPEAVNDFEVRRNQDYQQ